MGKLIPQQEIIKNDIQDYFDQSVFFSNYLEGGPTFITYYSKDIFNSSEDRGLENVVEVIGSNSPVQYTKIENFVMYNLNPSNIQSEIGELGVNSTYESEAVILPETVRPLPDDYFSLTYVSETYLFRITDVQVDKTSGRQFFKVQFELSHEEINQIELQIEENYELIHKNLGTTDKILIEKSSKLLIDYADFLIYYMLNFYIKYFKHPKFNVLIYKIGGKNIYNELLIKFIQNNDLFNLDRSYLNSMYIDSIYEDDYLLEPEFKNTLYYALQHKTIDSLQFENFVANRIIDVETAPFYEAYEKFYKTDYTTSVVNNLIIPHDDLLIHNINSNTLYNTDEMLLEDIIINYFNDNLTLNSTLLDDINGFNFNLYMLKSYLLIPCIIYILKDIKNKLTV
jgi:hypothetical protein